MHDLEIDISKKKDELQAWQSVIDVLKPCDRCDGAGEIRYRVAQDETEIQTCEKCKGKGVLA
jgi:DnaJ-class molecular chaperone